MNKIAEFIKQNRKAIGIKICPGIGAGKRNSKNG